MEQSASLLEITSEEMIWELDRELKLRARVYGRWIKANKITAAAADLHMRRLQAARDRLVELEARFST